MPPLRLSKNPFGIFRQTLAACCAHNLSPSGGQIPHLQSEMCFLPGTRPDRKRIGLYLPPMAANSARLFNKLFPVCFQQTGDFFQKIGRAHV